MIRTILILVILALIVGGFIYWYPPAPDIPFASYGAPYAEKPTLASVEHRYPLTVEHRLRVTPKNVAKLPQEKIDQLYARLSAGPIPDGPFRGTFFFADGGGLERISEILGGVKGFVVDVKLRKIKRLGEALWKGKVFYRQQRVLRNQIQHERLVAELFGVEVPEMRRETIGGREVGLLFPARLYCGQSLLDGRRESVIIDYAYSDEIEGYIDKVDFLAGRNGLKIRDEIRMVRPGFYLGRAYLGRVFLLNFTLYNEEIAERDGEAFVASGGHSEEECWPGSQPRAGAVAASH